MPVEGGRVGEWRSFSAGEMIFVQDTPPETLTALTEGRRLAWSRQSLASLFRRAPSLEVAFHAIVTRDLTVKLESVR